jgi:hypothetical protein
MARQRSRTKAGTGCLVLIVAVVVTAGGAWAWNALTSGPGASYKATVTGRLVVNPATLDVTVRVINTGQGAGTPSCQINASDPSGSYSGADLVTLQGKLQPGQATNFDDPHITITNQGARYVTQVTVTCS